jgi:hypothetical protein
MWSRMFMLAAGLLCVSHSDSPRKCLLLLLLLNFLNNVVIIKTVNTSIFILKQYPKFVLFLEAILSGSRNKFMNVFIANPHYLGGCTNSGILVNVITFTGIIEMSAWPSCYKSDRMSPGLPNAQRKIVGSAKKIVVFSPKLPYGWNNLLILRSTS